MFLYFLFSPIKTGKNEKEFQRNSCFTYKGYVEKNRIPAIVEIGQNVFIYL